jgi:hypothetical protein
MTHKQFAELVAEMRTAQKSYSKKPDTIAKIVLLESEVDTALLVMEVGGMMKIKGSKLEFISWIKRDGSGTEPIPELTLRNLQNRELDAYSLSISEGTYIVTDKFNYFVAKVKE